MRSRRSRHTFLRFSFFFVGAVFWNQLCTNFLHIQFLGQNVVDGSVVPIQLTADHYDCQTSIKPHDSPHFGHIYVRFWRARSSRTSFVFHSLTAIRKCFMPPKNLYPRYSMLSISPVLKFRKFVSFSLTQNLIAQRCSKFRFSVFVTRHCRTHTQLAVKSDVTVSSWNLPRTLK